jgi:uncharacterized protein YndB with AHSA1/START domain
MTTTVTVDKLRHVNAPAAELWAYVTDWTRHAEWIPLTRTETIGGDARAVGGKFRAWSGIGPLGFWDPMTVTTWREGPDGSGFAGIVHTGRIVKGDAEITVEALPDGRSTLRWVEHFHFGPVGLFAWRLTARLLDSALDRALRRLVAKVEAASGG